MANMKLTIQHNNTLIEPPVKEGVQIEWERTGTPGKLTFTTIKPSSGDMSFFEGDPVCFYYNDKKVFAGYIFKKSRDRENHIKVICYDQLRYFKNKFSYVFTNRTATHIIQALCNDFKVKIGKMDDTSYVIPSIAEENKSALDICSGVLEETLVNTGKMFVLYDDFGELQVKNCANMISTTLIMENTAENYDYSSSIDDETYNQVILYYKKDDKIVQLYKAESPSTIKKWGLLRYWEEVSTPTIGQNKANSLLKLYNKPTRELKITGAFGDVTVRGGTLIPVKMNLGDIVLNNYMLVNSVTHKFDYDHYTMDLTLDGHWEDYAFETVSETIGTIPADKSSGGSSSPSNPSSPTVKSDPSSPSVSTKPPETFKVQIHNQSAGIIKYFGTATISYVSKDNETKVTRLSPDYESSSDKTTALNVKSKSKINFDILYGAIKDGSYTGFDLYKVTKGGKEIRIGTLTKKDILFSMTHSKKISDTVLEDCSYIISWYK